MEFLVGVGIGIAVGVGLHLWLHRRTRNRVLTLLKHLAVHYGQDLASRDWPQAGAHLTQIVREYHTRTSHWQTQLQDWRDLAQSLPVGFLLVDQDNLVLECNLIAQRLLHIESWQPGVKVLLEWVRSYELDQLVERTRQQPHPAQDTAAPQVQEWQFYPPGGEAKAIPIRAWALGLSQGQIGLFLEDRLEAKTLVQQRDRWASDVAHELKTPLTSIRLVAETLQTRVEPALRTWVDRLLNETIRLSSLVQDLLELSSLNLGAASVLKMSHLDLVFLLQDAWQSLEPLAKPRRQSLEYQGPSAVLLWGDEQRLYRLFINLLDNSIKYGKPDFPIHVQIRQEGGHVWVEVYDHGPGLPADTFQSVFEPFYRTDAARARSQGGTGLGLAIVHQIVEAHGGSITAANHPQAGGLWIRLHLNAQLLNP
jgi:two-component system phosphate regulon sensor histidine kinase PhoR